MSEYLVRHFEYLKTLSFEDIEKCNIDWNAYMIPFNYRERVFKYNP
jgi:hypothetical protein